MRLFVQRRVPNHPQGFWPRPRVGQAFLPVQLSDKQDSLGLPENQIRQIFLQGLKPMKREPFASGLKPRPPKEKRGSMSDSSLREAWKASLPGLEVRGFHPAIRFANRATRLDLRREEILLSQDWVRQNAEPSFVASGVGAKASTS